MAIVELTRRRSHKGLYVNIAAAVLLTLVINGVIYALGWNSEDQARLQPEFAPPGWFIGSVWVLLFAAMGAARWLLSGRDTTSRHLVEALITVCALYPFYTGGLDSLWPALIGSLASWGLAVGAALRARRFEAKASVLLLSVVLWTTFATALVIREMQLN